MRFDKPAGRSPIEQLRASPMTYRSPRSGRQFVVIAAGGKTALKTIIGNSIVTFALPVTTPIPESH